MSISRYKNTKNNDFDFQNSFPPLNILNIESDDDFFYVIKERERIDQLSRRFLGDGRYWWVICELNNMSFPFGDFIKPGTVIRIPRNLNKILTELSL